MVIDWSARPASASEQELATDKLELKAQIRMALAGWAARHGIAEVEVDQVMWAYIDDAVRNLTLAHERGLEVSRTEASPGATIRALTRPFNG